MSSEINHVAIVGAGIGGLMSALALSAHGIRATLLERDSAPPKGIAPADSMQWRRKSVPQSLHPNFLMGTLRTLLEECYPDFVEQLLAAGAAENGVADYVVPEVAHKLKNNSIDKQLRSINIRRTTFEMVLREYVGQQPGIEFRDNKKVVELILDEASEPLSVNGVLVQGRDGLEPVLADAVIDASGRFSKLTDSLIEYGACIETEQQDSGIWYFTRQYRLLPGQSFPRANGLPGVRFDDFLWVYCLPIMAR